MAAFSTVGCMTGGNNRFKVNTDGLTGNEMYTT